MKVRHIGCVTKCISPSGPAANKKFAGYATVQGQDTARKLVQSGRIISAIKLLELLNPKISREQAKMVVHSFGLSSESRWPIDEIQPVRCL